MQTNGAANAVDHSGFHIVVYDGSRYAAKKLECIMVQAEQGGRTHIEGKSRKNRARPCEDDYEGIKFTHSLTNRHGPEMRPVHLPLLTRDNLDFLMYSRFDFGFYNPDKTSHAAEVADVALATDHLEYPFAADSRIGFQRLPYFIVVRQKGILCHPFAIEPIAFDRVLDRFMVDIHRFGDRVYRKMADIEQPSDFIANLYINHDVSHIC